MRKSANQPKLRSVRAPGKGPVDAVWLPAVLLAALLSPAVLRGGEEAAGRSFALRGATIYTISGEVLESSVLLVESGKIKALGKDVKIPAGMKVYDLGGYVVLPGLLDAETTLASDNRDTLGSLSPQVRALDGWDFYRKNRELLEGGVTSVYLSPGIPASTTKTRLISGQGAVVKTAGSAKDPRRRVVSASSGLQVTLGPVTKRGPVLTEAARWELGFSNR